MSVAAIGFLYAGATLSVMLAGIPIAFALGFVAPAFMFVFMPGSSLDTVAQNVYEEMASITLLSIPLFILKGAAIGRSKAGQDLYSAMHAWMHRIPGGLGIANVFACALFAAMAGSSPATCSAIGSAGIPEMRKRGYSPGFAAGIIAAGGTLGILLPPSITMILYAVAAEQSLGRLFLAGIGPGLLLVGLFAAWSIYRFRSEYAAAKVAYERGGVTSPILADDTLQHAGALLDAAAGAALRDPAHRRHGGALRRLRHPLGDGRPRRPPGAGADRGDLRGLAPEGLQPDPTATLRESTMLMLIIGMSLLYAYVMSYLHISQSAAPPDRGDAALQMGAAGDDPGDGDRARLLPAAGLDHPDDGLDELGRDDLVPGQHQGPRLALDDRHRVRPIVLAERIPRRLDDDAEGVAVLPRWG